MSSSSSESSQNSSAIKSVLDKISTTESPFTTEEEDAIVTLVVVVIGIIIAIIVLFSMGIFIDCRHQNSIEKKSVRPRRKKNEQSLVSNMCPTGVSDLERGIENSVF